MVDNRALPSNSLQRYVEDLVVSVIFRPSSSSASVLGSLTHDSPNATNLSRRVHAEAIYANESENCDRGYLKGTVQHDKMSINTVRNHHGVFYADSLQKQNHVL